MKRFVICMAILCFGTAIYSQDQKVTGGLYGCGGISWLSTDSKFIATTGTKISYGFGAMMDINLTNNFAITTALGYSNIGGSATYKNGIKPILDNDGTAIPLATDNKYSFSTSYVGLPIGIKGSTNEIGYFKYFLKAGIVPMVRIKSKIATPIDKNVYVANNITKLFNTGWNIGGGFEWSLAGTTRLLIEVLYTGTFIDLDNIEAYKDQNSELINPKLNVGEVSLKVGILF